MVMINNTGGNSDDKEKHDLRNPEARGRIKMSAISFDDITTHKNHVRPPRKNTRRSNPPSPPPDGGKKGKT